MNPMDYYFHQDLNQNPGCYRCIFLITPKEVFDRTGFLGDSSSQEACYNFKLEGFDRIMDSTYATHFSSHEAKSALEALGLTPNKSLGLIRHFAYLKESFRELTPESITNIYHLLKQI